MVCSLFGLEPPAATAKGALHQVDRAGQRVPRRARANADLDVDRRVVVVGEVGSEVAEIDAAFVVGILVEDQLLDAGARPLAVVERPPTLRRASLSVEAAERVEVGPGVDG